MWWVSHHHHPCCEGEHILIAVTDMQIQLTWIMSFHHADTPSSTCWDMADMCNWIHFLFFVGFIHLKVRLWDRVDRWARVNADQSILGLVSTAHDTGGITSPSLLSEGVSLGGVPSGLHCIYSNVVGTGGAKRLKTQTSLKGLIIWWTYMEVQIINARWRVLEGKGNVCHEGHREKRDSWVPWSQKSLVPRRWGLSWPLRSGGT